MVNKIKLACTCDNIELNIAHTQAPTETMIDVDTGHTAGDHTTLDVNATLALSTENKTDHKSNAFS